MSRLYRKVSAHWQADMSFLGKNQAGGSVQMGEIENQPGISPMELLLLGLAGCTGMDIVHILGKKQINLDRFEVHVSGVRADDYPMVYTEIDVRYLIWAGKLSEKAVEQAIKLSEEKYCSASAMMSKTAVIHSSYRILAPGEEV